VPVQHHLSAKRRVPTHLDVMSPHLVPDIFTSQTSAGTLATRIRNSPGWTLPLANCCPSTKCCSLILCFLSPGTQSFPGIRLAMAYARTPG